MRTSDSGLSSRASLNTDSALLIIDSRFSPLLPHHWLPTWPTARSCSWTAASPHLHWLPKWPSLSLHHWLPLWPSLSAGPAARHHLPTCPISAPCSAALAPVAPDAAVFCRRLPVTSGHFLARVPPARSSGTHPACSRDTETALDTSPNSRTWLMEWVHCFLPPDNDHGIRQLRRIRPTHRAADPLHDVSQITVCHLGTGHVFQQESPQRRIPQKVAHHR